MKNTASLTRLASHLKIGLTSSLERLYLYLFTGAGLGLDSHPQEGLSKVF
jgi:hypothetical protein